jgi:hypothetical protein
LQVKTRVEKIWLLCDGKTEMLYSKLITKIFVVGIASKNLGKFVNWATFAKETNSNQCSKFFKRMEKMEAQQQDLKLMKASSVKRKSQLEG